jgi:hypothetical protein
MASASPTPETVPTPESAASPLLVQLSAIAPDDLPALLANLNTAFPAEPLLVALSSLEATAPYPNLKLIPVPSPHPSGDPPWTLTAADFAATRDLLAAHTPRGLLILGPAAQSLTPAALAALAAAIPAADLALPCYQTQPHAGLVNSAILYPLTRALFATRVRFPLALDLGLSPRMAERLAAAAAARCTTLNQPDAILWPVDEAEAAAAGLTIVETDAGPRTFPQPTEADLNAILARVVGSLFADIDAKAAVWQRPRRLPPARPQIAPSPSADTPPDIAPMLEAFHLAYTNLRDIWALVLPPNSLLGLKRLAAMDAATFRMPDPLWARIVFDFLMAYRLRTINRGHLLGALTPLYLAWVASHIQLTSSGTLTPEDHIEALASAFETDKPYLVSRWRWPDRFNP